MNALQHVLCLHRRVRCDLRRTWCFEETSVNRGKIARVRGGERTAVAAERKCFSEPGACVVFGVVWVTNPVLTKAMSRSTGTPVSEGEGLLRAVLPASPWLRLYIEKEL